MIKKSIDYWVADFKLPTENDIYDAIEAARLERAVVRLHWHTPAYPYYGPSSDYQVEIEANDTVEDIMKLLPTSYAV